MIVSTAVPFLVSAAAVWLLSRSQKMRRYALALPIAFGFLAGYGLLPDWAVWWPTRHWHWLPYALVGAALVGSATQIEGMGRWERWAVRLLLIAFFAWVFVPTWSSLEPGREYYVPGLAAYALVACLLVQPLARAGGRILPATYAIALAGVAIAIGLNASVRYAQLAGVLSSATLGTAVVGSWLKSDAGAGASAVFTLQVGICGVTFVGYVEPAPPLYGLLLLPLTPLLLWPLLAPPLENAKPRLRWVVRIAAIVAWVALTVWWTTHLVRRGDAESTSDARGSATSESAAAVY